MSSQPYFGPKWDAPVTDDAPHTLTPVGEDCQLCNRTIVSTDQGWMRGAFINTEDGIALATAPVHRGCEMGTTIGHSFGFCSCTGYDDYYERGQALIKHLDQLKAANSQ